MEQQDSDHVIVKAKKSNMKTREQPIARLLTK